MRFHPGFKGAATPVVPPSAFDVSYITRVTSTSNLSTYTFSATSIGAADSDRKVYCVFIWSAGVSALSSATIGGITADIHIDATSAGAATRNIAIVSADVPTGTTADIIVNLTGSPARMSCAVYRVISQVGGVLTASDTSETAGLLSTTINVTTTGAVIAACVDVTSGQAWSWTGVTEDYDASLEVATMVVSGGFATGLSTETPRTIEAQGSVAGATDCLLACVSFSG
jgi:hypothetical protein